MIRANTYIYKSCGKRVRQAGLTKCPFSSRFQYIRHGLGTTPTLTNDLQHYITGISIGNPQDDCKVNVACSKLVWTIIALQAEKRT